MHRVRKFVEVDTGRIGYALTVDALSQASKGTKWNPDPSFSVGDASRRPWALIARNSQ